MQGEPDASRYAVGVTVKTCSRFTLLLQTPVIAYRCSSLSQNISLMGSVVNTPVQCRDSHLQCALNPPRCLRATVSGWTSISACFPRGQGRRNIARNNLSETEIRGCGCRRFQTASCCRRARSRRVARATSHLEAQPWRFRADGGPGPRSLFVMEA